MTTIGFPPLEGKDPKILILGSIPGIGSIRAGEYYFDGSNRMWSVLSALTSEQLPSSYEEKKALLYKHGFALWDYYYKVERTSSKDKDIESGEPNDFKSYLLSHPSIKVIAINGFGKYRKFGQGLISICYELKRPVIVLRLPETSGLNEMWPLDKLIEVWKTILRYV